MTNASGPRAADIRKFLLPEAAHPEQRRVRIIGLFLRFKDDEARRFWFRSYRKAGALAPSEWRVVEQDCLAPYLATGDAVLVDFDRRPVDGDLVLVAMRYRRSGMIGGDFAIKTCESVKQYREINGERHLCAAAGHVSADPHSILGTIVGWYRPCWWRRPSPRRMRFPGPAAPVELEHAS